MVSANRYPPCDERATFTSEDIIEEALIEALADLGVAEQAATRATVAPALLPALRDARQQLERARALVAAITQQPSLLTPLLPRSACVR